MKNTTKFLQNTKNVCCISMRVFADKSNIEPILNFSKKYIIVVFVKEISKLSTCAQEGASYLQGAVKKKHVFVSTYLTLGSD